ncbi:hypothetical protein ACJX0J_036745, partial [Zea mays]
KYRKIAMREEDLCHEVRIEFRQPLVIAFLWQFMLRMHLKHLSKALGVVFMKTHVNFVILLVGLMAETASLRLPYFYCVSDVEGGPGAATDQPQEEDFDSHSSSIYRPAVDNLFKGRMHRFTCGSLFLISSVIQSDSTYLLLGYIASQIPNL